MATTCMSSSTLFKLAMGTALFVGLGVTTRTVLPPLTPNVPRLAEIDSPMDEMAFWFNMFDAKGVGPANGVKSAKELFVRELNYAASLMKLKPGMTFADVGGGDGMWGVRLLERVLPGGHLFVTDTDPSWAIPRMNNAQLNRLMTVVKCDDDNSGLPRGRLDALFLRMSFHHIHNPYLAVKQFADALKPGGRLLIADHSEHYGAVGDPYRLYRKDAKHRKDVAHNPAGGELLNPLGSGHGIEPWVVRRQVLAEKRFELIYFNKTYPGYMFKEWPFTMVFVRKPDKLVKSGQANYYYGAEELPNGIKLSDTDPKSDKALEMAKLAKEDIIAQGGDGFTETGAFDP